MALALARGAQNSLMFYLMEALGGVFRESMRVLHLQRGPQGIEATWARHQRIVEAVKSGQWGAGILGSLGGLFTLVCGVIMLFRPVIGLAAMTLVLAVYFLFDGITRVVMAFKVKPVQGWGWMLFNGIVTLLLGFLIWRQWPVSGTWAIGTLVGIHLVFDGWGMIFFGSGARRLAKTAA